MSKSPTPRSLTPPTEAIDDGWGMDDLGPPREPSVHPGPRRASVPSVPPGVIGGRGHPDRPTPVGPTGVNRPTVPADPPPESTARPSLERISLSDLAIELESRETPDGAFPAPRKTPEGAFPAPRAASPREEPVIELADVSPRPARHDSVDDLELQIDSALESPLAFVDHRIDQQKSDHPEPLSPALEAEELPPEDNTVLALRDRYAVGDFTGALVIAESILETDPENEHAKRYAQSCLEVLTQMYAARLGPLDQIVNVCIPPEQITWLSLDHRAGFLLSLVDGVSSVEEILDISGMGRLEALRILYTLVQQNVVALG